jgi:hypothetical protein
VAVFQGGRADGNRGTGDKAKKKSRTGRRPPTISLPPEQAELADDLDTIITFIDTGSPAAERFARETGSVLSEMLREDEDCFVKHGIACTPVDLVPRTPRLQAYAVDARALLAFIDSHAVHAVL